MGVDLLSICPPGGTHEDDTDANTSTASSRHDGDCRGGGARMRHLPLLGESLFRVASGRGPDAFPAPRNSARSRPSGPVTWSLTTRSGPFVRELPNGEIVETYVDLCLACTYHTSVPLWRPPSEIIAEADGLADAEERKRDALLRRLVLLAEGRPVSGPATHISQACLEGRSLSCCVWGTLHWSRPSNPRTFRETRAIPDRLPVGPPGRTSSSPLKSPARATDTTERTAPVVVGGGSLLACTGARDGSVTCVEPGNAPGRVAPAPAATADPRRPSRDGQWGSPDQPASARPDRGRRAVGVGGDGHRPACSRHHADGLVLVVPQRRGGPRRGPRTRGSRLRRQPDEARLARAPS